jgi:NitT/TauT family transport system substrate-binding protein
MRANSKKNWFASGVLVIVGLIFFTQPFFPSEALAVDEVTLRLSWKVGAEHVPYIVAMDKGFYKKEGINISIKEGSGSTRTLKLIGAGQETFGQVGVAVSVKGVIQGIPVKQIMRAEADNTMCIISRSDSGISTPKDLKGKIIAGSGSGVSDIFESFLGKNNLSINDLTYLAAGKARMQAVASGKAHGTLALVMNDVYDMEKMGVKSPQVLVFRDFGSPPIGSAIIAHIDTIKKNPDMIKRFVRATIRGFNHTFMDLEGAADIAVKHFPMALKERLMNGLKIYQWQFLLPLGWQNPKNIEDIRKLIADYGGIPEAKDFDINKCFTNEFMPEF